MNFSICVTSRLLAVGLFYVLTCLLTKYLMMDPINDRVVGK